MVILQVLLGPSYTVQEREEKLYEAVTIKS